MFRWSVLGIALLLNAPTIWAALAEQTVDVTSAMVHYLITVPIVAILLGLVRYATKPAVARRRASIAAKDAPPSA